MNAISPSVPPFAATPQVHSDLVQSAIAQLYQDSGENAPDARRPIPALHRLLEACDLNGCELENLSKASAMQWLLQNGGLRRAWNLGEDGDKGLAGFLYANSAGGCVFVEALNPISRRRFSAAHELGHYLLHFRPNFPNTQHYIEAHDIEAEWLDVAPHAPASTCRGAINGNIAQRLDFAQIESEADAFAAELLMPRDLVHELAANARAQWGDADLVWRLSQTLLVSRKAMFVRLRHLGWLDGHIPYADIA